MNGSILRTRYSKALLRYCNETGGGERVSLQAERLASALGLVDDLESAVCSDIIDWQKRRGLLEEVLREGLADELDRFFRLLEKNGRMDHLRLLLLDFLDLYYSETGLRKATLRIASEPDEELLENLRRLAKKQTGCDIRLSVSIDPDLIGGFVFDIDNAVIDTSIARRLEQIRLKYKEKNRRII